ncbi:hypothetical protein Q8A73_022069 [Channa argus]|nr:hypothetical protein Q8A73_022069 [Channa argus]
MHNLQKEKSSDEATWSHSVTKTTLSDLLPPTNTDTTTEQQKLSPVQMPQLPACYNALTCRACHWQLLITSRRALTQSGVTNNTMLLLNQSIHPLEMWQTRPRMSFFAFRISNSGTMSWEGHGSDPITTTDLGPEGAKMAALFPIAKLSTGALSTPLAVCLSTTGPPPPCDPGGQRASPRCLEDLTISCRGREATLACQHSLEKRKEKNPERDRKRGRQEGEEKRMMKNKANARVAASGQRRLVESQQRQRGSPNRGKLTLEVSIVTEFSCAAPSLPDNGGRGPFPPASADCFDPKQLAGRDTSLV